MEYTNYFPYPIYNQQIHQKHLHNNYPHPLNFNYQQFQQCSPQQHFNNHLSIFNHSKSLIDDQTENASNPENVDYIPIQYQQYSPQYRTYKKHLVYKHSKSLSEADPKSEDSSDNFNFTSTQYFHK